MIVDVNNLDITALRCYLTYLAASIAQANKYGINCNTDEYVNELCKASRYYWLTQNCIENLTESLFCEIDEYIDDLKASNIYVIKSAAPCINSANAGEITGIDCDLSVTDPVVTCTSNLSINIFTL